jgi:hypothetical protein
MIDVTGNWVTPVALDRALLEAQLARKRRNAKAGRARRKRGQYRRTITITGGQFRRLAELGYLKRVDNPAAQITALEAFLFDSLQ